MSEIEKLNMIAEWQEQHKQLIEDLDNSKRRIVELEERVWRQKKKMVEKTKKIADLEAQIEKMKNLNIKARDFLVGYLRDFNKTEVGWRDKVEDFVRYELKE